MLLNRFSVKNDFFKLKLVIARNEEPHLPKSLIGFSERDCFVPQSRIVGLLCRASRVDFSLLRNDKIVSIRNANVLAGKHDFIW
jgi:acetyl esterase/lipase